MRGGLGFGFLGLFLRRLRVLGVLGYCSVRLGVSGCSGYLVSLWNLMFEFLRNLWPRLDSAFQDK